MSNQTERREYPRIKAKWPVTMVAAETQIEGAIENLTPKGMFVSCAEIPAEDNFRMVIKAPGRKTINVAGRVVWTAILEASESETRLGIGIEFTDISESDLQYLYEIMNEYQQE
jgi:Tfp pilus assembly protein PilZ